MHPLKETIKILKKNGYELHRHGANHDIYQNPKTKQKITLKRHDFNDNDKKHILKQAGLK